jgi:hypothetical protein
VQGIVALNDYSAEVYGQMCVARLPHYIRDQCLPVGTGSLDGLDPLQLDSLSFSQCSLRLGRR